MGEEATQRIAPAERLLTLQLQTQQESWSRNVEAKALQQGLEP